MNKNNTYGFKIDDDKLITLAKTLKDLRHKNNLTLESVSKKTKIDASALYKIEQGFIQRINPFMLKELAKIYNVNIINFYKMINYLEDSDLRFEPNSNNKIKKEYSTIKINEEYEINYDPNYKNFEKNVLIVLKYKREIFISKYNTYENIIYICDIFSDKNLFLPLKEVTILGKILKITQNYL